MIGTGANRQAVTFCLLAVAGLACGDSSAPPGGDGGANDGQAADGQAADGSADARPDAQCGPVPCSLACERARGPDGCEICDCAPPDPECVTDDDCVVAENYGRCCDGCGGVYPRAVVEAEPCLVAPFEVTPGRLACRPTDCTPDPCPPVDCVPAPRARCNASGQCEAVSECPEGEMPLPPVCVPLCENDGDCAIATVMNDCCPGCPWVYPKTLVDEELCLVEQGQARPEECEPECDGVACPDLSCAAVDAVECRETGQCLPRVP